jgi:peptide deformylase
MALEIAQLGQPVLREVALEVAPEQIAHPKFQAFLEQMHTTLAEHKGAGLAAPQVFVGLRVFLAAINPPVLEDEPPGVEVLINPKLTPLSEERKTAWEGCLSFEELLVLVPRYRDVRVEYLDAAGAPQVRELHDFPARVVQHELDHLDGILTIDRAASTRDIIKASEIDTVLGDKDE